MLSAATMLALFPASAAVSASNEAEFEESFVEFEALPDMPEATGNVVDITEFEPPVEEEARGESLGAGVASYYGRRFHGRPTASGERFDMNAMTAAHKTLPFGSMVRVTNTRNGNSVVVRVNDRGPFVRGRTIDVSRAAAEELGMVGSGRARVELELIS